MSDKHATYMMNKSSQALASLILIFFSGLNSANTADVDLSDAQLSCSNPGSNIPILMKGINEYQVIVLTTLTVHLPSIYQYKTGSDAEIKFYSPRKIPVYVTGEDSYSIELLGPHMFLLNSSGEELFHSWAMSTGSYRCISVSEARYEYLVDKYFK